MWQKIIIIGVLFIAAMAPATASTWESNWVPCEQVALEGTWPVVVCGPADCFGENCLDQCELQIDAYGTIQNTGAQLNTLCGIWAITGGTLNISSGCVIQGEIETSAGTLSVQNGAILENELVLGLTEN